MVPIIPRRKDDLDNYIYRKIKSIYDKPKENKIEDYKNKDKK